MAKSRKRRPPRIASKRRGFTPPSRPYRSITSQMTPADYEAVRQGADAELRGDAAEALRLHRSVPMFRQSTHGDCLDLLAQLGDEAPSWLVSRWLTVLARRRQWSGGDEMAPNRILQSLVPMLYPDYIPWERMGCTWPEQVLPFISERDWVVRQADVYDLGALRDLVRRYASPELLARADDVDAWARSRMRGLRVESVGLQPSDPVVVLDLHTSELVEVMNLGVGVERQVGEHLLGRLVPTKSEPGMVFDWRPLGVDERTARAVARTPTGWLPVLHRLLLMRRLEPGFAHQPETSLTADLPRHAWMNLLGTPLAEGPDRDPDLAVTEAMRRALVLADEGADAVAGRRHLVSELMLDVSLTESVRARFSGSEHLGAWRTLADVLPPPARARCEAMVLWCELDLPENIA